MGKAQDKTRSQTYRLAESLLADIDRFVDDFEAKFGQRTTATDVVAKGIAAYLVQRRAELGMSPSKPAPGKGK